MVDEASRADVGNDAVQASRVRGDPEGAGEAVIVEAADETALLVLGEDVGKVDCANRVTRCHVDFS